MDSKTVGQAPGKPQEIDRRAVRPSRPANSELGPQLCSAIATAGLLRLDLRRATLAHLDASGHAGGLHRSCEMLGTVRAGLYRTLQYAWRMNFYDWMIHKGLSSSSARSYDGALRGPLSEWAMDGDLIAGPLTALTSSRSLDAISRSIRELPIFKERNARGHHMYSATLSQFAAYLASNGSDDVQTDLEQIISDPTTTTTEKTALIKSRIGQGTFRDKVLLHWTCCAITGFSDTSLLIASHILPWKKSTNSERLDPWNGLLLSPNLDKAFDKGFITFEVDGSIRLSPLLSEAAKLGITPRMKIALQPEHEKYMVRHRTEEFKGE